MEHEKGSSQLKGHVTEQNIFICTCWCRVKYCGEMFSLTFLLFFTSFMWPVSEEYKCMGTNGIISRHKAGHLQKPLESQHVQQWLPKGKLGLKQNMFRISEWNSDQISSSSPSILLSCESEAISNGFPSSLNCMFCRSIGCIKDEHVHDQQWSHTVQKPRSTLICFTTWKTFFLTTYGSSFMNSRFIILFISYHFIGCLIYCQNNSVWECGGGGGGVQIHTERVWLTEN